MQPRQCGAKRAAMLRPHPARPLLTEIDGEGADTRGVPLKEMPEGPVLKARRVRHQALQCHWGRIALVAHLNGFRQEQVDGCLQAQSASLSLLQDR